MLRLTLFLLAFVLLIGCSTGSDSGTQPYSSSKDGYSPPVPAKSPLEGASPKEVVYDYLSAIEENVEIVSSDHRPTTLKNMPATAVHVVWRKKGENEQKSQVFIIQQQAVRAAGDFDPARSFEDNVAAAVSGSDKPAPKTRKTPRPPKKAGK